MKFKVYGSTITTYEIVLEATSHEAAEKLAAMTPLEAWDSAKPHFEIDDSEELGSDGKAA